tara:strand:+ start:208 stop:819 length:612 start_codon:yes stop_codon:yes gene_type:complete
MTNYVTHNDEPIDTDGTHLQGYIACNYNQLVDIFGPPVPEQINAGYKVDWKWNIKFSDDTIATIYNWENGPNYCGSSGLKSTLITEWHVGGFTKQSVAQVELAIRTHTPTDSRNDQDGEFIHWPPDLSTDQIEDILARFYNYDKLAPKNAVIDLFTDIRHYCRSRLWDYETLSQQSKPLYLDDRSQTNHSQSIIKAQQTAQEK